MPDSRLPPRCKWNPRCCGFLRSAGSGKDPWTAWPPNMGQICCSETSVRIYHSTLRKISKERRSKMWTERTVSLCSENWALCFLFGTPCLLCRMQVVNHLLNALFVTTFTSGCLRSLCLLLFFDSCTRWFNYKERPVWKLPESVGRVCRYEGNTVYWYSVHLATSSRKWRWSVVWDGPWCAAWRCLQNPRCPSSTRQQTATLANS